MRRWSWFLVVGLVVSLPLPVEAAGFRRGAAFRSRTVVAATVSPSADLYQQALASATYRAERGIKGHSHLDTGRRSGVGWASHDSTPMTCLGRGGANYAVVRGRDGWYATKF